MKKIFCILLLLIATHETQARVDIDSLARDLKTREMPLAEHIAYFDILTNLFDTQEMSVTEQIVMLDLIQNFSSSNIEGVLPYMKLGLTLAKKVEDKPMMAKFCNYIAGCYDAWSKYDSSYFYFEKTLVLATELKSNEMQVVALMNIANSYHRQSRYTEALEYNMRIIRLYENKNMETQKERDRYMFILGNIGEIYLELKNFDRAFYYIEKARLFAEVSKHNHGKMQVFYVLGVVFMNRGELDTALEYEQKAAGFVNGYETYDCLITKTIAQIYFLKKDYDQASEYAQKSLFHAGNLKDPMLLAKGWSILSNIYREQERYKESEDAAFKALEHDSISLDTGPNLMFNIGYANIFMGDKVKSATYFKKYDELKNQYIDKDFRRAMTDMEVKYETEKKEMRISALERQKMLYIAIGITGVLLAITLWTISRQKIRQARQEKQLVASHAIMEGEKEERRRLARDLHDGLGGMLSAVKLGLADAVHLQGVRDKLDSCIDELDRLAHHLMPASLSRFGLKAAVEDYCRSFPNVRFHFFGTDQRIDEKLELVVYYCAYELMNNSFKHSGAENIDVQLIQDDEHISLTVQDDGCGFDKALSSPGTGLKNLTDRVAAFNGKMDITTSPGNGTETNIELKIENAS